MGAGCGTVWERHGSGVWERGMEQYGSGVWDQSRENIAAAQSGLTQSSLCSVPGSLDVFCAPHLCERSSTGGASNTCVNTAIV
eukprot:355246-Chlamydomonas_euryale.AAC.6